MIFDSLQRASFGGFEFPVQDVEMVGELRDHVHEFWHSDAGQPEKGGRKNWIVTMNASFFATYPSYPNLWPKGLDSVRDLFARQVTAPVHIPTVGTINMYCRRFRQTMRSAMGGGERVELVFVEDNPSEFILDVLVDVGETGLRSQADVVIDDYAKMENPLAAIKEALAKMDDAVNSVLAVKDQADVYGLMLESRIERLSNQCDQIDRLLDINSYGAAKVIDSLHDLWGSANKLSKDLMGRKVELKFWTTPSLMSASEVSARLYGDNSRAVEILQLNGTILDAFAIVPNTVIRYYPAVA